MQSQGVVVLWLQYAVTLSYWNWKKTKIALFMLFPCAINQLKGTEVEPPQD